MYINKQRGFSGIGAIIGAVVGIAIVVASGGAMTPAVAPILVPGGISTAGTFATIATGHLVAGAAIGGIAGGLLGGSSSSGSGSGMGSSTAAAGGEEPPAVDCSEVQKDYSILQQKYQQTQQGLQQAQQNLEAAGQMATNTPANYNAIDQVCFPGGNGTATPCGQKNKGSCDDLQNQCNNLQALIDSTNQAACQIQTSAMKLLAGGTASTTANPSSNVFTLGLTPNSVAVGGTFTLVTTISFSNVPAKYLNSFSITVLDSNGNSLGNLASNTAVDDKTIKQVTLQYNFQLPTTIGAGSYTVKIYNDANIAENATAALTVTGTGTGSSTSNTQNNSTAFSNVTLSPTSIYAGSPFTLSASVNSSSVQAFSVTAFQNGQNLGKMSAGVPVGTTVRPTTVQQTFKTNTSIPPGAYTLQISDDANPSQYQNASLTVLQSASFGQSVFTGQTGAAGTYVYGNGTSNVATGGAGQSSSGNICNLSRDLQYGNKDGSVDASVSLLQSFLFSAGFFKFQVTGYFGAITKVAVQNYQSAHGVPSTGYVGPLTRGAIQSGAPCK